MEVLQTLVNHADITVLAYEECFYPSFTPIRIFQAILPEQLTDMQSCFVEPNKALQK